MQKTKRILAFAAILSIILAAFLLCGARPASLRHIRAKTSAVEAVVLDDVAAGVSAQHAWRDAGLLR